MSQFIVKNESGTFVLGSQPIGFVALSALENRFFICESPITPNGDFVVPFPEEQQTEYLFYPYPNGKKLWFDPFNGSVEFDTVVDNKNRRAIMYTDAQLSIKLSIMKWLMLNVWIPDKARMLNMTTEETAVYIDYVNNNLTDDISARTYINKNLYYNL